MPPTTPFDPNVQNAVNDLKNWFKNLGKFQHVAGQIVPGLRQDSLHDFAATPLEIICQGDTAQCAGNKTVLLKGCKDTGITAVLADLKTLANLNQTFLEALEAVTNSPVEALFLNVFLTLAAQYRPACHGLLVEFNTENFRDSLRNTAGDALLPQEGRDAFRAILNADLHTFGLPWTSGGRQVFDTPGRKLRDEINLLLGKETLA